MMVKKELISLLIDLWLHLNRRRQLQFIALLGLMIVSTFFEIVSLGMVMPFLAVLTEPEKAFSYSLIANLAKAQGIYSANQLVLPLTVSFAASALIAGIFRILLLWVSTKLAFAGGADLSNEVYRRTLYQSYQVHIGRNSSEVISGITNKVSCVVFLVLLPLLTLISSSVLLVAITAALIVINPSVALIAIVGFGSCYGLMTLWSRQSLRRNSISIARQQTQVIKALQEGLGGIRDVLLDGLQSVYCDIYKKSDHLMRSAQGNNIFIAGSPRYAMEALGMVLIAALAYVLTLQTTGGVSSALPLLGALALGAQRLLPTMQQSYASWASIAGSQAALADTIEMLEQPLPSDIFMAPKALMLFQHEICFDNVQFRYGNESPWVLTGLNLTIVRGARIGFVGSTGSGKSTLLDLLMGLLLPTTGNILVDGAVINNSHLSAWQRTIAHVPQSIFLADATLLENIAFGVPAAAIDLDRVIKAACQAQISEFIESCPEGYQTNVGERGVRLSGGQRQRIGIARALYKDAKILVFDEATSALDSQTEQSVMDAIEGLNRDLTILLIAHRITTLKHCDTIVELGQGKVLMQGTYAHLFDHSLSFRKLAQRVD
jgi:ATP-binding cassette, subfamily B, bacterial PglK